MTMDRTPANAPAVGKPGQCFAFGCPMWAGIKSGEEWLCDCHAMSAPQDWQDITQRLRENIRLVRACHWAMNLRGPDQARRAGEYMERIGRPDLAPQVRKLDHSYPDRHTGERVERIVERDESEYLGLWVQRLRSTLFREATQKAQPIEAHIQVPQHVDTWTRAAGLLGNTDQEALRAPEEA
ncbi:hypothetical protein GNZ10_13650 [Ralstonia sp. 3N]|uniref:hypothetical protein n=1 Tax=Ralstonia sp. 3N TaxID=2675750 RepID=UPI0015C5305D|nr:hypothetical protein [Ralstonia sp. 3N]NPT50742.1 hypothetical protein [Ralstonia sp. 3N]